MDIQQLAIKWLSGDGHNIVISSIVVILLVIAFNQLTKSRASSNIPYLKGGYPIFGQVFEMVKGSPWDTMTKWSLQFDGIFRFHLFGSNPVCVTDPELIKIIFSLKLRTFQKDVAWTYKPFLDILGKGIVTSEGHSWMHQRKLLSHHLRIDILELIPNMAFKAFNRLKVKLEKAKESRSEIEMAEEFRHLTLQVIAEALVSLSPEESDETFATMYLPIVEEGNARTWNPERMYLPTPSWFKYHRDVKKLNDYVTDIIRKRWTLRQKEAADSSSPNRPFDILDKMLDAIKPEDWSEDSVIQARDEIKTFVLAGHETSASMLTWSVFELSRNPEYLAKVIKEADEVFKDHIDPKTGVVTSLPSREHLQSKLIYSECCLRESLRKYSIVPVVVRLAAEDVQLGEYTLPKGQTVMVLMQGVHHNPKIWPEPLTYRPDRFLEEIQPYTFLPFIEGARVCLGQHLSLLESKIILSLLVKSFRFESVRPEEAGIKHPYMVPIIPKTGHHMMVYDK